MTDPVLQARGLSKRLAGRSVLEGVELTCGAGEVVLVIGSNGSGKSTLLRLLAGILAPDAGEILVLGHALARRPVAAKSELGYVPDGAAEIVPDLLVSELVVLVRALRGLATEPSELEAGSRERLGIAPFWHRRVRSLSFGQQKRVLLSLALSGDPALLLLDEPSNGLDEAAIEVVSHLIEERRARGRSHVIATNDLEFAQRVGGTRFQLVAGRLVPFPR